MKSRRYRDLGVIVGDLAEFGRPTGKDLTGARVPVCTWSVVELGIAWPGDCHGSGKGVVVVGDGVSLGVRSRGDRVRVQRVAGGR